MKHNLVIVIMVLQLFVALGCARHTNEEIYSLAPKLNKLVTAAQGYESFVHPDPSMDGQVFLKMATEHDPDLLAQFKEFQVNVLRHNGYVSILLCSPSGEALLQDVGCTNSFDNHLWRISCKECEQDVSVFNVCVD